MPEYREGQTATNPKTGQKLVFQGGQWVSAPNVISPAQQYKFDRERDTVKSLDELEKRSTWDNTGMIGGALRGLAGWNSYNFGQDVETINARNAFGELQAMRDASKTGGALGAIAVPELMMLKATGSNLDPNQSEKQFDRNIQRSKAAVTTRTPGLSMDNPIDLTDGRSRASIPVGAFYMDAAGNVRVNQNRDKGNPIVKPAAGTAAPLVGGAKAKATGKFEVLGVE